MAAITNLDFRTLGTEFIDLLTNILPNEQEVKAFKNYESDGKPLAALSPTDQFLIQVSLILSTFSIPIAKKTRPPLESMCHCPLFVCKETTPLDFDYSLVCKVVMINTCYSYYMNYTIYT